VWRQIRSQTGHISTYEQMIPHIVTVHRNSEVILSLYNTHKIGKLSPNWVAEHNNNSEEVITRTYCAPSVFCLYASTYTDYTAWYKGKGKAVRMHTTMVYDGMKTSGQLHAPATLTSGKETPSTQWIEDWVGSRCSDKNKLYSPIKHPILKLWLTGIIRTLKTKIGKWQECCFGSKLNTCNRKITYCKIFASRLVIKLLGSHKVQFLLTFCTSVTYVFHNHGRATSCCSLWHHAVVLEVDTNISENILPSYSRLRGMKTQNSMKNSHLI
jgi:hypothetical protein